jgi:hypothetical protein
MLLLMASCCLVAGDRVTLHLADGRVVDGEITAEDSETVSIATKMGAMSAVLRIPRTDILSRTTHQDPLVAYAEREARTPDTATGQVALARWCGDHGLRDQAVLHTVQALELEPDNPAGRALASELDLHLHEGRWLTSEEYMAATGLVRVGKEYLTTEEAAHRRDAQNEKQAQREAADQASKRQAVLASAERQLAETQTRLEHIGQREEELQVQAATAEQAKERYRAMLQARSQPPQTGAGADRKAGGQPPPGDQPGELEARRALELAKADNASAEQSLKVIARERAGLRKDRQRLELEATKLRSRIDALASPQQPGP